MHSCLALNSSGGKISRSRSIRGSKTADSAKNVGGILMGLLKPFRLKKKDCFVEAYFYELEGYY